MLNNISRASALRETAKMLGLKTRAERYLRSRNFKRELLRAPTKSGDDRTAGQKSIRRVQNGEIHLFRILDLISLARLAQTFNHRNRRASKHMFDLECLSA